MLRGWVGGLVILPVYVPSPFPRYTIFNMFHYPILGFTDINFPQLIHKVRGGQRVVDAVDDIVRRGVSELRKNAFGDDMEDAKALPWTREQAWAVLKALSGANEVRLFVYLQHVESSTKGTWYVCVGSVS